MADLYGPDPRLADAAYMDLFHRGTSSIPFLLEEGADRMAAYQGSAFMDPRSSLIAAPPPTQGVVSLYLVEAIRLGRERPHTLPVLLAASTGDAPPDAQARAAAAYRVWWQGVRPPTRDALRAAPDPLAGTGLRWR
ncbi:MAG: hypothetical protein M9894_31870 [Planctomycetes bacterium]|nr:hypothetical protein [Planctomycetota bacterium]